MFEFSNRRALTCVVLSAAMLFGFARAEEIAAPTPPDNKAILAYLVVQNPTSLIAQVEKLAQQVVPPDQYQPGMVAKALGTPLGDPTLAGLGKNPFVAMFFAPPADFKADEGKPPMALFIPVTAAEPTESALHKEKPESKTFFDKDVLIFAPSDEILTVAKAAKVSYDKIAASKLTGDARLYVNIAGVNDLFGLVFNAGLAAKRAEALKGIEALPPPFIKAGLKPEFVGQIVNLGFNAIEGLLNQSDAVQLDLSLKPDGVLLESTYAAKPGTIVAGLFQGTMPAADPNIQSFLKPGFYMIYVNSDPASRVDSVKKMIAAVAADPNTAPLAKNEIVDSMSSIMETTGGEMIYSIGAGEKSPEITFALGVKDGAKYLSAMEKQMSLFGKDSVFSKFYEGLGMKYSMTYEKAERTHAGVEISRLKTSMEMPTLPPEIQAKIAGLTPNPETAIVKGYALTSSSPAKLDAMIDSTLKGDFTPSTATIKSMALFGKGKNLYFDYDMIGYLKFTMALMQGDPGPGAGMFGQMKEGDPILMAGSQGGGRAKFQIQMPFGPFLQFVKTMQAMQQGMIPKQPAKEDGTF